MLRLLKLALAIGIPAVALWVTIQFDPHRVTEPAVPFFVYLLPTAAPQLILLAICARRSSRNLAVIGGLVSLDAWLIFITWLAHPDIAELGWLIYLAASPLFAIAGIVIAKGLARLTRLDEKAKSV
jgi:hypothetical protein